MQNVSFGEAIKTCFSKYADFSGRARRSEFWYWTLFSFLVGIILAWIPVLGQIICLAFFVPGLAVSVRRLHDIGRSGWWYLLCFVPIVGPIILIVWYCTDSQPGSNKWGTNPKE